MGPPLKSLLCLIKKEVGKRQCRYFEDCRRTHTGAKRSGGLDAFCGVLLDRFRFLFDRLLFDRFLLNRWLTLARWVLVAPMVWNKCLAPLIAEVHLRTTLTKVARLKCSLLHRQNGLHSFLNRLDLSRYVAEGLDDFAHL